MRKSIWITIALILAAIVGAIAGIVVYRWQQPKVRERIETILSERLGSRVELRDLSVKLGPVVRVSGGGLVLHHREHTNVPPMIRIERFDIDASVFTVLRRPYRVEAVHIEGLHIFIPPRRGEKREDDQKDPSRFGGPSPVVIGRITSENALLEIASSKPDREPKRFEIHDLELTDFAFDRSVPFDAHLTNPVPKGTIRARGAFGPWDADTPSLTPVEGDYSFQDADLGTIDGIAGRLNSEGRFSGRLEQIRAEGKTTTPDFALEIGGRPVPLETVFTAIVDGTNGDTLLDPVKARLGETPIEATGGVVHVEGRKGRTVSLDVKIEKGRLEDVLRLALDQEPEPLSGVLSLKTQLEIPPGPTPVPKKLQLEGDFTVHNLAFASDTLQEKIDDFSRRARGKPTDTRIADVPSTMRGRFRMRDGVLRLSGLQFDVRGARVRLDGRFTLESQAIDFRGTVRMDARLSQMMKTGWKSLLLKAVDPIFAKEGAGAVLPIKITGTARNPKFGLEVGKIF